MGLVTSVAVGVWGVAVLVGVGEGVGGGTKSTLGATRMSETKQFAWRSASTEVPYAWAISARFSPGSTSYGFQSGGLFTQVEAGAVGVSVGGWDGAGVKVGSPGLGVAMSAVLVGVGAREICLPPSVSARSMLPKTRADENRAVRIPKPAWRTLFMPASPQVRR